MSDVPEISVNSVMETSMIEIGDSEVDFVGSTLQKKQREIRVQLKKNPELNSKTYIYTFFKSHFRVTYWLVIRYFLQFIHKVLPLLI